MAIRTGENVPNAAPLLESTTGSHTLRHVHVLTPTTGRLVLVVVVLVVIVILVVVVKSSVDPWLGQRFE